MQTPAPITPETFDLELRASFPTDDEDRSPDWEVVIQRMFEDFVLIDLRGAPDLEFEDLIPALHDASAATGGFDAILGASTAAGETAYTFARIGSEEELPVLAILYWTGDRIAIAIPEQGNLLNAETRAALGRHASDEMALGRILARRGIPAPTGADYKDMVNTLEERGPWDGFCRDEAISWMDRTHEITTHRNRKTDTPE